MAIYGETGYGVVPYAGQDDSAVEPAVPGPFVRSRASKPEIIEWEGSTRRQGPPVAPFEGRFVPPHNRTTGSQDVYGGYIRRVVLPVVPPDPYVIISPRRIVPVEPIEPGTTARRTPPIPEQILNIHKSRSVRVDESEAWAGLTKRTDITPILFPVPDIHTIPSRKSRETDEFAFWEGVTQRQAIPQFLAPPEPINRISRRWVRYRYELDVEHHGTARFRPQPPSGEGPTRSPCPPPPLLIAESDTIPIVVEESHTQGLFLSEQDSYPIAPDECR